MAVHVGERLGDDPVHGDLDRGRQRGEIAVRVHADLQLSGPALLPGRLSYGPDQAEVVQAGWAQTVHQPTDLADGAADLGVQLISDPGRASRVDGHQVADGARLQCQPGQRRAKSVVQVTAQPPALLLTRRDEPFA